MSSRTRSQSGIVSIRTKFLLLSAAILILACGGIGFQSSLRLTETIQGEALEKAKSDLQMGYAYMDEKYPGEWHIKDGELYKGETRINGNFEIVDAIGEMTNGDTATIFLHDTRVTTNVVSEGQRAVGTKVSDVVAEAVLRKGETYLGQANVVGHTYQAAYMPLKDAGGNIIGMWYIGAPDASDRIRDIQRDTAITIAIVVAVVVAVAIALNYLLMRPIIRRIQWSAQLLESVAHGELSHAPIEVKSRDETGTLLRSVNQVTADLRSMLAEVQATSQQVAASSRELTDGTDQSSKASEQITIAIQEVASGTSDQLTMLTQAYETVSDISGQMDEAARVIQQLADYSVEADGRAKTGAETVTETVGQMTRIQQTVEDAARTIYSLEEKSMEIDRIVEVISQIASQTNLLALNAGIEAARAGEHGKGFAVVAGEVRKLADQTGKSAEEIRELTEQVQAESRKAALSMNAGTEVVKQGMLMMDQSGQSFQDLVRMIAEMSTQSREIAGIAERVSGNAREVVQRMEQSANIAEQTASNMQNVAAAAEEQNASFEQIAAAAEYLGDMAGKLKNLVDKFRL